MVRDPSLMTLRRKARMEGRKRLRPECTEVKEILEVRARKGKLGLLSHT